MDKVLAFSILSASPADISAGAGFAGSWARMSWRRGVDAQQASASAATAAGQQREEEDKEKRGSRSGDGGVHATGGGRAAAAGRATAPRFAPEFDGIDCFETIVSH